MKVQRMKMKTFYAKLKQIFQSKSFEELPSLMATALKFDLPILVVMASCDVPEICTPVGMSDKKYVRCLRSMDEFETLEPDLTVEEMNLKLVCRELISQACEGICFIDSEDRMIGLEWSDFIPDKSKL